jgi:prepilin peptidase CpaA
MSFATVSFFLVTMLAIGSLTDIRTNRIPNLLTLPFALGGMAFNATANGMDGFLFSLAGCAAGIGFLIIPYLMSGMGAGDVKLMGAVGSFLGAKETFEAFLLIALFGGIYSVALIVIRRDVFKGFFNEKLLALSSMVMLRQYVPIEIENTGQKPRLKYGVAIALGTIMYLLTKALGVKFFI